MARRHWYELTYPKRSFGKLWVLKAAVFSGLRRLSYRTPMYAEAKRRARIRRGKYLCAKCGNIFGPKQISIDHISPVIALTGFISFDEYIKRLFVPPEWLQVLCKPCHKEKTKRENRERRRKSSK